MLFSLTPDSKDHATLNCMGQDGQIDFPHDNWKEIEQYSLKLEDTIVSQSLSEQDRFTYGQLNAYFNQFEKNGQFENDLQGLEHSIIAKFFDLSKDEYLSLLFHSGTFVHIVYKKENSAVFKNPLEILTAISSGDQ